MASPTLPMKKVGMISLGCAKNLVDAEIMLGSVRAQGMEITASAEDADVLIVNTCAFIDSAKEESIEAILEAHQGARTPAPSRPEAHRQRLHGAAVSPRNWPRDARGQRLHGPGPDRAGRRHRFARPGAAGARSCRRTPPPIRGLIDEKLEPLNLVTRQPRYIPDYDTPRFRLTPAHSAYVKIAEGCNHPCSFCVIPQMRGRHRSRTIESVVREVRQLVAEGVREINLISQDTTYYGMDLWTEKAGPTQPVDSARGVTLSRLLEELQGIEGDFWIRLLYTHPAHWSDELIATIARCPKVARYIDMPLQHIHPEMLAAMRRETSREHIEELIVRLRAGIPGLTLRTTFIVGFPGETEEHFESLLEFIGRVRFERLGVFNYSQEEGSRAAKMPGQLAAGGQAPPLPQGDGVATTHRPGNKRRDGRANVCGCSATPR